MQITNDIVLKETIEEFIISKEVFKNYFNERNIIAKISIKNI